MFNAPKRKIIWDHNDILPVGKHAFEDFSFSIPSNAEGVADDCFPGWPYMQWTSVGMIILQRMFCLIPMFAPRWQGLSTNVINSYNGFD